MKKIVFCAFFIYSCILSYNAMGVCRVPAHLLSSIATAEMAEKYCNPISNIKQIRKNEIVLFTLDNTTFKFGSVAKYGSGEGDVLIEHADITYTVHQSQIRQFKPLARCGIQLPVSEQQFKKMLKKYLKYALLEGYLQADPEDKKPYAHIMNVTPESQFIIIGDLHGSLTSLNKDLTRLCNMGIIDANLNIQNDYNFVFLGDLSDRGPHSVEVIYTIMQLAVNNEGKVFICRGNHENLDMNEMYSFTAELERKFGSNWRIKMEELILDFYDSMPHVLLLGLQDPTTIHHNFILCCHGGLELEAHDFLRNSISCHLESGDKTTLITLPGYIDTMNGFNWNDFHANPTVDSTEPYTIAESRGSKFLSYSHYGMVQYLRDCSSDIHRIVAIMRGHQHQVGGIGILRETPHFNNEWELLRNGELYEIIRESVFTFISSPEGVGTNRDTFGILRAGVDGIWRLTPYINNRTALH